MDKLTASEAADFTEWIKEQECRQAERGNGSAEEGFNTLQTAALDRNQTSCGQGVMDHRLFKSDL